MIFKMKMMKKGSSWEMTVKAKSRKKGFRKLLKAFRGEASQNKAAPTSTNYSLYPGSYNMEFSEVVSTEKIRIR